MAMGLHRAGCPVALLDIEIPGAEEVAREISDEGGKVLSLQLDVSKKQDFERCLKKTLEEFGRVAVLGTFPSNGDAGPQWS